MVGCVVGCVVACVVGFVGGCVVGFVSVKKELEIKILQYTNEKFSICKSCCSMNFELTVL